MDDDLLPIGRFATLTGLTVTTLRHYDEAGLLEPAHVDRATSYRRYRADQVATARAIAALRELDLSIPAIRALLTADDAAERAALLADERRRLEARTARLQRALHRLSVLSASAAASASAATSDEVAPSTAASASASASNPAPQPSVLEEVHVPTTAPTLEPEIHRALGAGLFNKTWDLLEIEQRTPDQDDEMVDTAHASAWHWRQVGTTANRARGHWMLARVYSVLGRAPEAVHHARRANEILEAGGDGIEDWDRPSAAEAMARALWVAGDLDGARAWKARGEALAAQIAEDEDRKIITNDLATVPV